jgi:glycosyltransferase involved in cell wall biosynthesis
LPRLLDTVAAARNRFAGGAERVEVIVADNGSTDSTAKIARERGCRVVPVQKRCIAAARNGGASAARGQVLAFCDADFRIHPDTFNFIAAVMRGSGYVGGGTGLTMERWSPGIVLTWWLVLPPLRLLGLDGGVWFCRRDDFVAVGGYDDSVQAGEDVGFLMKLRQLGRRRRPRQRLASRYTARVLNCPAAVVINSSRKFDKYGDWHFLALMLKGLLWLPFGRRRLDEQIQRMWSEGR